MTIQLKTLKEIEPLELIFDNEDSGEKHEFNVKGGVDRARLKQEAIKWIKELRSCLPDTCGGNGKEFTPLNIENGEWCEDNYYDDQVIGRIIQFIKYFFNITEEELR